MRKILISAALVIAAGSLTMSAQITSFPNGTTWADTEGNHINCHGGCVVRHDGAYYWFGESRTGGHSDGISVYRSKDLYNWENLGYAVTHGGERDDEDMQDISEGRLLERPKVIYNAKTGKWVMWAHWENGSDYGQARVAILKADDITGPYTFVKTMRPNNHDSRDQTLFLDTGGNAYHLCSTNMNTDINLVKLSDDFLDVTDQEKYIMNGRRLEASTVCKAGETYFATFSECNGWDPAPGHSATAVGDMLGEWTEGLNFCVDPNERTSYRSQGAYVFSVGDLGYDPKCFIFYGDRWNPNNVGGSTYVWLPLSVRSGYPTVRDFTTWNLDDIMKGMYRFKRADKMEAGKVYSLLECNSNRLVAKVGEYAGFKLTDNDDNAMQFMFEATSDQYEWLIKDVKSGRYWTIDEGRLRETADKGDPYAVWTFILQPDGYYKIYNRKAGLCVSPVGYSRNEGTYLEVAGMLEDNTQKFGVYFDSDAFDYKEAPMFTKAYFDKVAEDVKKQNFKLDAVEDNSFVEATPRLVKQVVSRKVLTFFGAESDNGNRRPTIAENGGNDNQKLTFRKSGNSTGIYNIVDNRGYYLYKNTADGWTMTWGNEDDLAAEELTPSSPEATFTLAKGSNGYSIRNMATKGLLGTDSYDENSTVYGDKSTGMAVVFTFVDPDAASVVTDRERFLNLLDEVDIEIGSISENMLGNEAFDISKDAFQKYKASFNELMDVKDNYSEAISKLEDARLQFETNRVVRPIKENTYYIRHISGRYLKCEVESAPMLGESDAVSATEFRFLWDADNEAYNIVDKEQNSYLSRSTANSWDMIWSDKAEGNRSLWNVEWSPMGYKAIYNKQTHGCLGSDEVDFGSVLYGNKGNNANFSQWVITTADNNGVAENEIPDVKVMSCNGGIKVYGSGVDVSVFGITGIMVRKVTGDNVSIILPAGIYVVLVKKDGAAHKYKVAVK